MPDPRSILIACDKFKGSLDARAACEAIARGLGKKFPDAEVIIHPIADGGEGFAAALETPLDGRWVETDTHDALGRPVRGRYLLADGPLAALEMAEASGMWRIRADERDILRSNTFGTGELMRHAIENIGARQLVIGLGGSATNDGGAGMAAALGVRFLDANGGELPPTPDGLFGKLAHIDFTRRIELPEITVACDVDSPLLGPLGATCVFGPQKGADENTNPILESVLESLARLSEGLETAIRPGAGAAGGLGFGLMRFANATLVPGFDWLADLTKLEQHVARADLIVTGEGSLDAQSLAGKGPVAIAKMARAHGKPVVAFCGKADAEIRAADVFDQVTDLAATGLPVETLIARAAELLESAAAES
ncbi:MAG TPA: glycerate kinase [Luteolibacter sp.]|nr:glycerate kinase [Luteolibacter sp.]